MWKGQIDIVARTTLISGYTFNGINHVERMKPIYATFASIFLAKSTQSITVVPASITVVPSR